MKKVTYKELKDGYILKKDDVLDTLHGFDDLQATFGLKCWLHNPHGLNSEPYEYLGIDDPKDGGAPPEFDSAEELTKNVISLFEKSPYKVGDKVRILERDKDTHEYPFSFVDEMLKYVGEIFTIKKIEFDVFCDKNKNNGDFHKYSLNTSETWAWHSSMFEKADSDSEIKKKSVLKKKYKYEDGQRLTICGKTYRVHRNIDNNFLIGDGHSNRQVFIDLGIISELKEDDKLNKWIESRGFTHLDGSFPPIKGDQFDDFIDLLLQMGKDQGSVCQCKSQEDSYKFGDKVRLGEDEYRISKYNRGYYLYHIGPGWNDKMFTDLGINKREWLISRGFDYNELDIFPEQKTLERLNEVIKALQKEFLLRAEMDLIDRIPIASLSAGGKIQCIDEFLDTKASEEPREEKLKFAKKKKNIHITL